MADIIFYHNPMSRGQIARWALEEAGADYEQVLLDYGTSMKDAAYLKFNPMGKVPCIVHQTDAGEQVVTEAAAICAYLADAYPAANLAPTDAERADYYRWLFYAAGPVEQAVSARSMGWAATDPQKQGMLGFGCYDQVMDTLDGVIGDGRTYICGDRFTMADVYFGSHIDWGLMFGSIDKRPSFEAYAARLKERPAYQKAKAIDGALIAEAQAKSAG